MASLSKVVGTFLCLIGLGFIVLLVRLRVVGLLTGDIKVSVVMIGFAALLLWVGTSWLLSSGKQEAQRSADTVRPSLTGPLLKLRRPVEIIAAAGSALMVFQIIALIVDIDAYPTWLLSILVLAPVPVAWFIVRISAADAFPRRALPQDGLADWSRTARLLVPLLVRIGWFGYAAMLLYWFRVDAILPGRLALAARILISLLIALLYASQVLILHFGDVLDGMSKHNNPRTA